MEFYLMYPPDRYRTTYIKGTFPEHHWPLEHTRHQIKNLTHDITHIYEQDIFTPRADIRETPDKYYIDVELPGVTPGPKFSLQWSNPRTLMLQGELLRPENGQDQPIPSIEPEATAATSNAAANTSTTQKADETVHYIAKERRIGQYARAFHFYVEVNNEKLEANLKNGLLSIVIPKIEVEHSKAKTVEVHHTDA